MLTQYEHAESGDRIKCQSFDYEDGEYRKHIFTFDQDVDVNDDPPNPEDHRGASAARLHPIVGQGEEIKS